jgi:Sec-independent protein translocase protein TatA
MFFEGISLGSIVLIGLLAVLVLGSQRAKTLGKDLIATFQEVRQSINQPPSPEPITTATQEPNPKIKPPQSESE